MTGCGAVDRKPQPNLNQQLLIGCVLQREGFAFYVHLEGGSLVPPRQLVGYVG
jgi:hypothetical protein